MKEIRIYQSKMNVLSEAKAANHFEKAKTFIFYYAKINIWHSIENIPSSIVGEFFKMWDDGVIVNNKKIELDETDQYYRIIKTK
jgi:hypothetical protein